MDDDFYKYVYRLQSTECALETMNDIKSEKNRLVKKKIRFFKKLRSKRSRLTAALCILHKIMAREILWQATHFFNLMNYVAWIIKMLNNIKTYH